LLLNLCKLGNMIFELIFMELLQIVIAQNHVLDKLCDFLVEFYHVRSTMDKVLDRLPVEERRLCFLGSSSERANQFAENLGGLEG